MSDASHRIVCVAGRALPLRGDDIDTDRIMPARFLRSVTFEGLERHVFEDERTGSSAAERTGGVHPFDDPRFQGAAILIVNSNFGCGSSREHAPQGLLRWGIKAVIGESFSEIFFGNAAIIGLPCVKASAADVNTLMDIAEAKPATVVTVDLAAGTIAAAGVTLQLSIDPKVRDALVTGAWDTTGLLLERYEEVDATAARLPYVTGF